MLMEATLSQYPASERWIHESCDMIIFFPAPSRVVNMKLEACMDVCREMGMLPYWQTMCILVDERTKAYTIAFNTKYQLPTYETTQAMAKKPVVELLEWPDRFFVEAKSKDHWTRWYGGEEIAPHMVDLSMPMCDCEDFKRNVAQARQYGSKRTLCSHIIAAQGEQNRLKDLLDKQVEVMNEEHKQ